MIRKMLKSDIEDVCKLWLETNINAHHFIDASYWKSNFEFVKEALPQAEVYVYECDGELKGFIGLNDTYIEGIFVSDDVQSQGIGKALLDDVKKDKTNLHLNVYSKNTRAIKFYQREGFTIKSQGLDESTGEIENMMIWSK